MLMSTSGNSASEHDTATASTTTPTPNAVDRPRRRTRPSINWADVRARFAMGFGYGAVAGSAMGLLLGVGHWARERRNGARLVPSIVGGVLGMTPSFAMLLGVGSIIRN